MEPISFIETPFPEKFGVPRQSLLVDAYGKLVFPKDEFYSEAFRGLEGFSHLWLIFEFHLVSVKDCPSLIRPPRFHGKKKLGVFATRSPHRPNRLGLSVVKYDRIEINAKEVILWVKGVDLVNGTPIYDIKPYIPYADSLPGAEAKLFKEAPISEKVIWREDHPEMTNDNRLLIEKVLALDPRPGQDKESTNEFGMSLAGWNIRFKKGIEAFEIIEVTRERLQNGTDEKDHT